MQYHEQFDVIVVGGGHAGTEAATAAARMGLNTLLLTHNIDTLGHMSCNPAIGGIGKGHLVKEVDALGGIMAQAIDLGGIQFRTLNSSKGPAVRATRAQADRLLYKAVVRQMLENYPNLKIFQQACDDLVMDGDRVAGVVTQSGIRISGKTVVLSMQLPFTIYLLVRLTSSREVMGSHANPHGTRWLLSFFGVIITLLNLYLLFDLARSFLS